MNQGKINQKSADPLQVKREDSARENFKHVLSDLLVLLRKSTGVETTILYWVNNVRGIFVRECHATVCDNIMLPDRISIDELYLKDFADLKEPVQIKVGEDISADELTHYFNEVPVSWITIIPFINNGETVALTVLESEDDPFYGSYTDTIESYEDALANLLRTYLELSGLSEDQSQWNSYETQLEYLAMEKESLPLVQRALDDIQGYLEKGGVSLIAHGMGRWNVVLQSRNQYNQPPVGMHVNEHSIAWKALEEGKPQFEIHFNSSPKRLSPREPESRGATLAVPIIIDSHRHGVVLISDENPIVFSEAVRHKLINLIRVVSLKLAAFGKHNSHYESFFSGKHGAVSTEIMEATLDNLLGKDRVNTPGVQAGLVTVSDLPTLRASLRLETLNFLQQKLIEQLNPQQYGFYGFLGWHSDYVYSFIIYSDDENAAERWKQAIGEVFDEPVYVGGESVNLKFHVGWTHIKDDYEDYQDVFRSLRHQLSQQIKMSGAG